MTKCIVKECKNTTQKNSGVTLHGFPNSLSAIKVWLIQTGNDFGDLEAFAQRVLESRGRWLYRMCSKHFSPRSYIWSGKKLVLKPDAVPTIFPGKVKNKYVMENIIGLPPSTRPQMEMQLQLHSIIKHGGYHPTSLYMKPNADPPLPSGEEVKCKPGMKSASTSTGTIMVDKSTNTDPTFGKADKGVLWPEFEYNYDGEAWKIKHDHVYPHVRSHVKDSDKKETYTEQDFWLTNDYEADKKSRHYEHRYPLVARPYMERDRFGSDMVPVKSGDVAVYFSRQEWEYIVQHRELYQDYLPEEERPFNKFHLPEKATEEMLIMEDGLYSSITYDAISLRDTIKEENEKVPITDSHLHPSPATNMDSAADEFLANVTWFSKCYKPVYVANGNKDPGDTQWFGGNKSDDPSIPPPAYNLCPPTTLYPFPIRAAVVNKIVNCTSGELSRSQDQGKLSTTDDQSREDRPHRCRTCNGSFPDKNQLAVHRRKHIAKSLRCSTCGKAFRFQSHLLKHQKTHKKENVYTCPICGVQYEHKVQFAAHMRVHPGEKPYSCDECGSCFAQKGSLVIHQNKHTGLDVYKCKLCGNRFDKRLKLKNHLTFHRLDKTPFCS